MDSFKKQVVKSIKWTSLQTAISGGISPLYLIIQAKFLSPGEFAYMAIIMIVIGLFQLLEGVGISQAIIQRDKINAEEISSIFFFNVFLSILLAVVLYAFSPLIAALFSLPKLKIYLPVLGIMFVLSGPSLLYRACLQKELLFKQLSLISIVKNISVITFSTCLLVMGYGVLGIIFAQILGVLIATISIWIVSIRLQIVQVSLCFKPKSLLPFLRFGVYVSGKQMMTFIVQRLDELLIAYYFDPEILGMYYFGKNLIDKLRSLITRSFGAVLFPLLSKIQHDRTRLLSVYRKISLYIALVAFPLFSGIALTAYLFVPIIFGEQWSSSIPVFQICSIAVIPLVLTANVSTSLLYSSNRPGLVFAIDLTTNGLYLISLFFFVKLGMFATLICYSCYIFCKTLILQYFANRELGQSMGRYFVGLFLPILSDTIMVILIVLFLGVGGQYLGESLLLLGAIVTGVLSYSLSVLILGTPEIREFKTTLLNRSI